MKLKFLSLINFRNFSRLDIEFPGKPLLLTGKNGAGKTSILEAIYYLATFYSFHASNDKQLINFLSESESMSFAKVSAEYIKGGEEYTLEIRMIRELNKRIGNYHTRKEIYLNGIKKRQSEAVSEFNAVLFLPHMMSIIEGGPERRRRYLNITLSQVVSSYGKSLTEYNKVLTQRNSLLKKLGEKSGSCEELDYWDDRLAHYGSEIIHARKKSLTEIGKLAVSIHNELSGGQNILKLEYRPSFDPSSNQNDQIQLPIEIKVDETELSTRELVSFFKRRLRDVQSDEIQRGTTTIGPHRDDIRFINNGIDLGVYGSRGQVRTAILAVKIAEVQWMKAKTNSSPILLLDEVLAELDHEHRSYLLRHLVNINQTIFTTTDMSLFYDDFISNSDVWNIIDGGIVKQNSF